MNISKSNLTVKLFFYLFVACILPICLLGVFSFNISKNIIIEQAEAENIRMISSLTSYLKQYQNQIEDLAATISGNAEIGSALTINENINDNAYNKLETNAKIGYILNNYIRVKGLVSINIFSKNGNRFQIGESLDVSKADLSKIYSLINNNDLNNVNIMWMGIDNNLNTKSTQKKVISIVKLIKNYSPISGKSDVAGILIISLNNEIMRSFLEGIPLAEGSQLMEIDHSGNIMLHSNSLKFGEKLDSELLNIVMDKSLNQKIIVNENKEVSININNINLRHSKLVIITSRDLLTQKVNNLAFASFGFVLFALFSILYFSWSFTKKILAPIRCVSDGFRQLSSDCNSKLDSIALNHSTDEIYQLINGYNEYLITRENQKRAAAELIEAKCIAEAANIAKSRFLATMSHEIRTPMNGILGMAQMLLTPNISEVERTDYANTVLNSGRSLLSLLNDILDFSKIEAGKIQLDVISINPEQILRETCNLFSGTAKNKNLAISFKWTGPVKPCYKTDGHRIRQMISNLVGNALKFTQVGQIVIEAREISLIDEIAILEFSVIDTGIGISEDKQDLLFKPFSQTDSSTTRQFGGSGLGLSIVSSLAKMMNGNVGVESSAGKGSRFWFSVEARLAYEDDVIEMPFKVENTTEIIPDTFTGNILVVEDNMVNRMVITALLTQLGIEVTTLENGKEAVNYIIEGAKPDLILMDLHMPVMDGYEATINIRNWEKSNGFDPIPILALTADAFDEDRKKCLSLEMNDFLTKPIAIAILKTVLYRWLNK